MNHLDKWYKEKLECRPYFLKESIEVTEEFKKHTGGKFIHGKVTTGKTKLIIFV